MKINEKGLSAAIVAFNSCRSAGDIDHPIAMRMQSAIAEYLAAIEEAGFVVVERAIEAILSKARTHHKTADEIKAARDADVDAFSEYRLGNFRGVANGLEDAAEILRAMLAAKDGS